MVRQCSDSVVDATRAAAKAFLASRPDLGPADLAQYSTLAESTVRCFLRGNPGGHEVIREMDRVMSQAKAGEILQPGGQNGAVVLGVDDAAPVRRVAKVNNFYQTHLVRQVGEVCDFCLENRTIGVVTSNFGNGKTEAIAAWRRGPGHRNNSIVFEFDEFSCRNVVDFVKTFASMLDVEVTKTDNKSAGEVFRRICDKLRETPMLLIFDQCETARPRVFQCIRQIHDRTHDVGVGVVILSAPILLARMNAMADLGALSSRVGIWAPLPGFSKGEMAAIVKKEGLTDIDESAFDIWFKLTGGSMRRLMRAVDLLRAKHVGKRITEKTIAGVAGHLWGMTVQTSEER